MNPTLDDVAKLAGVSESTVSRTFSDGPVNAATKERVLAAAAQLGYRPNRAAQALSKGRTGNLGLVVPDLANPFFTALIKGISEVVRSTDYHLVLTETDQDASAEAELIDTLRRSTDGIILVSPRMAETDLRDQADPGSTVVVNRLVEGVTSVTADVKAGVEQAVAHLTALGHRRLAYVSGPAMSWSQRQRVEGLAGAREAGLDIAMVETPAPTFAGGVAVADQVLATGATAVIAFNDLLALGVMNRLAGRGVHIPGQMSLVGNDDIDMAAMASPALTTVASPKDRLGRSAAERLVRMMDERRAAIKPAHFTEPCTLLVRASTAPVDETF